MPRNEPERGNKSLGCAAAILIQYLTILPKLVDQYIEFDNQRKLNTQQSLFTPVFIPR